MTCKEGLIKERAKLETNILELDEFSKTEEFKKLSKDELRLLMDHRTSMMKQWKRFNQRLGKVV